MKNISFLLVLSIVFLAQIAWAQPSFYISPEYQLVNKGDQVCYTIKEDNFSDILSINFTVTWDPGVLQPANMPLFPTPSSLNQNVTGLDMSDFIVDVTLGTLTFDWSNGQPCNITDCALSETLLPDHQILFEMCFIATGEYGNHSPIDIPDGPPEVEVIKCKSNCQNIMEPGYTSDGFLSIGTDPLRVNISSADGFQGETVCLDFSVEDFDNLIANQYYIFWNPNILQYKDHIASGIPGFGPSNVNFGIPGMGVVSWNAVGNSITIPDGTQILQLCFKILGSCGQSSPVYIDNNGDDLIEIIDDVTLGNGVNIGLLDSPGEVSVKCFNPNGINMTIEDKDVCPGETFTVDITVSNFQDVVKLQYGLKWNPSIIQLLNNSNDGISFPPNDNDEPCFQYDSPATLKTFPSQGRIEVDWSGGFFAACDMFDGERLMRLHFKAIGPGGTNSTISVVNPILVDLQGGLVINVGINNDNGLVSICELDSPTLIAGSGEMNPGDNVCIGITTIDFEDIITTDYNISWEPAILSYTGVQNFNLPGLDQNDFIADLPNLTSGNLGVTWESGSPISVLDGTTLFEVCFDVIGDPNSCSVIQFTDNFVPLNIETSESSGTNVGLNGQQGEICVSDPFDFAMSVSDVFGTPGEKVYVDVKVENFIQLKRLRHSISWASTIIQYDSLVSTGVIPGFNNTHFNDSSPAIDNGQMIVDWSTNNINGISVPDGTSIFRLYFTIIGSPGLCSGVNIDGWATGGITGIIVNSALTGSSNLGMDVTDGSVCVNQSFLVLVDSEVTHVDCPSTPSGAINLTITGGSGNYNYTWAGSGVNPIMEDQVGLSAGFYDVTISDAEIPTLKMELEFQVELSPTAPIANAGIDTSFSCVSGVATLTLNGSGSSQTGATYLWTQGTGFPGIIIDGKTTLSPTVIGGSQYILTVTQTGTGCVVKDTVKISPPVFPNADIKDSTLTEITCAKDTIHLFGGIPQFVFDVEWIAGPGGHIVPGTDTTMEPMVTEPGWYYLEMKHPFTGCEGIDSIYIDDNRIDPNADAGVDTSMACNDFSVPLDGSGSALNNATYLWSPVVDGEICGALDQLTVNACAPGTYQLIVTDTLNGCTALDEVVVIGDTLRPLANAGPDTALTCIADTIVLDGSASSQGGEFEYTWLDPMGFPVGNDISLTVTIPGVYTLGIENTDNGCTSSSEVFVKAIEDPPVANATVDNAITCLFDTATLDATGSSFGALFTQEWMDPFGALAGTGLTLKVTEPGTYMLIVKNIENDCTDEMEVLVDDQNDPIPVEAGADTLIGCADIELAGSLISPNQNILIQWSSPTAGCIVNGTTLTPTISCPGLYKLLVYDEITGCLGEDSLMVIGNETPPVINAGDDLIFPCSETELQLNGISDVSDVSVVWSNANGDPINNELTLTPTIEVPGAYLLTVTSNVNQCTSTDFIVITPPILPTAIIEGGGTVDCANTTMTLSGAGSTVGVDYLWTTMTGTIPAGQETQAEINVPAGIYVLTVEDDLGCMDSASFEVESNGDFPNADAGENAEIPCDTELIMLDGSGSDAGMNYLWTDDQGAIIGSGLTAQVSEIGVYTLTVTNPDNQCQSVSSVTISQATSGEAPAEASFDHDPCALEAMLLGNLPTNATGIWTTSTGASIQDPLAETTLVSGLGEGENIFNWTLSLGNCVNYSTAQITIGIDHSVPIPADDAATLIPGTGGSVSINVLQNDSFNPAQTTFNVLTSTIPGDISFSDDGTITYTKIKCYVGTVDIEYELCNTDCPELCKTATLTIDIELDDDDNCGEVSNGITPNGDGINDEFVFDQLLNTTEDYPNNEMIIFNRWGDIVYQAKPYLNDWAGTNNSGKNLPHGTYYYILRLDISVGEIIRGDVTILK